MSARGAIIVCEKGMANTTSFPASGRVSKSKNIVRNMGISASMVTGNVSVCALL